MIAAMDDATRQTYLDLFVTALHPVFVTATLLSLGAFMLTFALKEIPLRTSLAAEAPNDAFQLPREATSLAELERIIARVSAKENRWQVYLKVAAEAGITLAPDELWLLARIAETHSPQTVDQLTARLRIDPHDLAVLLDRLRAAEVIEKSSAGLIEPSPRGRDTFDRLIRKREDDLQAMLADWNTAEVPEVRAMLAKLASSFAAAPPTSPAGRPSHEHPGS